MEVVLEGKPFEVEVSSIYDSFDLYDVFFKGVNYQLNLKIQYGWLLTSETEHSSCGRCQEPIPHKNREGWWRLKKARVYSEIIELETTVPVEVSSPKGIEILMETLRTQAHPVLCPRCLEEICVLPFPEED